MAVVESVDPEDVDFGHALPLTDLHGAIRDGNDGLLSVYSEGVSVNRHTDRMRRQTSEPAASPGHPGRRLPPVVHDGGVVVGSVQIIGLLLVEVEDVI